LAEQLPKNNAVGQLSAGINNVVTTFTLNTGQGSLFGSTGNYRVRVEQAADPTQYEIMLVTARSGDTFTVTRGQEGTSGISFTTGDVVAAVMTEEGTRNYVARAHQVVTNVSQLDPNVSHSATMLWYGPDGDTNKIELTYDSVDSYWFSDEKDVNVYEKTEGYWFLVEEYKNSFNVSVTATTEGGAHTASMGIIGKEYIVFKLMQEKQLILD
jgi:hypothetical protein